MAGKAGKCRAGWALKLGYHPRTAVRPKFDSQDCTNPGAMEHITSRQTSAGLTGIPSQRSSPKELTVMSKVNYEVKLHS